MIAAGFESATVLQTGCPVNLLKASTLPPGPPPGTKTEPCVPTITLSLVTAGVARALSNGTPLAAEMLDFHLRVPVCLSTAYRKPAQSGT